jgi:hypothetical protein
LLSGVPLAGKLIATLGSQMNAVPRPRRKRESAVCK